jgi:hypothetical protein
LVAVAVGGLIWAISSPVSRCCQPINPDATTQVTAAPLPR